MFFLAYLFHMIFCSQSDESCSLEDNTCSKPFDEDSVRVSLWKDSSYITRYGDIDLLSIENWVYVLCEIADDHLSYSINYVDTISARPIPRQRYRASLMNSRSKIENILYKGEISDLEIDPMDETLSKRGFHFRIEKEVFDFRENEEQEQVYLEVTVTLDILHLEETFKIKKLFFMRITFGKSNSNENDEEKTIHIYSRDEHLKGLVSLAKESHPFVVSYQEEKKSNIFWYHYYYQAVKRIQKTQSLRTTGKYVAVNHILSQEYIGVKDLLTETLRENPEITSKFYPTTYVLSSSQEREEFVTELLSKDDERNIWILKAGGLSEGRGTQFVSKVNGEIRINDRVIGSTLSDPEELVQYLRFEDKEIDYISQKYVTHPLLYNGYKIGIRQFFLIASIRPLRVLLYDSGFCTFGSSPYKNLGFDDMTIHLTNVDRQPDDDKPEFITPQEFAQYVEKENEEIVDWNEWYQNVFRKQVKNVVLEVMKCYNLTSIYENEGVEDLMTFGLFGADFVMDEDHHLWLNEVQRSPSLRHTGTCLKSQFMPDMIVETLKIVNEIRRVGERNAGDSSGLKDLESIKRFEWVINDSK